jgi:hypothetical protein
MQTSRNFSSNMLKLFDDGAVKERQTFFFFSHFLFTFLNEFAENENDEKIGGMMKIGLIHLAALPSSSVL